MLEESLGQKIGAANISEKGHEAVFPASRLQ